MLKNLQNKIIALFFILLSMIFIPLLSVCNKKRSLNLKSSFETIKEENIKNINLSHFTAFDESTGKIIKIPDKDFLIGVVCCEMPAIFEKEALKAQAVASYTYFSREREKNKGRNYDFKIDTKKWVNYIPKEQMKIKWKDNFEVYYEKIKTCVDEVFPEILEENGDLILAAYHAISSGKTEKCSDVFGSNLDYLINVESLGDKFAKGYETKVTVDSEKFKKNIQSLEKEIFFSDNPNNWVENITRTEGGMVKEITICSKKFKGPQIRNLFSLRSSDFDVNYNEKEKNFLFTVRGYGHGVGMSQNGAEYMAKNGSDYKQILSWYYPKTSISKLKKL